jgi:hypothetical protein
MRSRRASLLVNVEDGSVTAAPTRSGGRALDHQHQALIVEGESR